MSQQYIYQFINEYNINNEVRASYNSIINTIDYPANNVINEIHYRNNIVNPIYYDTYIINNILDRFSRTRNNQTPFRAEPITFTSNAAFIGHQCSICWENVESIETMALTKCPTKPHVFHKNCINTWIQSSASCPNCRCQL
jgi:hypothetical protein